MNGVLWKISCILSHQVFFGIEVSIGAEAIYKLLKDLDLTTIVEVLREDALKPPRFNKKSIPKI